MRHDPLDDLQDFRQVRDLRQPVDAPEAIQPIGARISSVTRASERCVVALIARRSASLRWRQERPVPLMAA